MPEQTDIIDAAFKRLELLLSEAEQFADTLFTEADIRVDFTDLLKFITALEEVFLNSDKTAYWLGCLSNHDIRQVLVLSRDLINSPHLGFDEAFKAYVTGTAVHIPEFKIRTAMIRGRYDIYSPDAHKCIHNVFDLNAEIQTSPLLGMRILQVLKDAAIHHGETKTNYISKANLIAYVCAMGFERRAVALWLDVLLKRALVFNYDPTCVDEQNATQLEIAPTGELHLFWGRGGYEYLSAIAETTPIRSEEAYSEIAFAYKNRRFERFHGVIATFLRYLVAEDQIFCRIPDHGCYAGQVVLTRKVESSAYWFEGNGRP